MKVYIAGPMTAYKDQNYNFPAFYAAQGLLEMLGHTVVNPARMDLDEGYVVFSEYEKRLVQAATFTMYDAMRRDIREIALCDAIVLLPGWEQSTGAGKELRVAREDFGMPAYTFQTDDSGWPVLEELT